MITSQRSWPRYLVYGLGTLAITAIATAASAFLFGPVLGHFESFMEGFFAILPLQAPLRHTVSACPSGSIEKEIVMENNLRGVKSRYLP